MVTFDKNTRVLGEEAGLKDPLHSYDYRRGTLRSWTVSLYHI